MNSAPSYQRTQPPFMPAEWASQHNYHWQLPDDDQIRCWIDRDNAGQKTGKPDDSVKAFCEAHHLPQWLQQTAGHAFDRLPSGLACAWTNSRYDDNTPMPALARLNRAVEQIEKSRALDAVASIGIESNNDDIRIAAQFMAQHSAKWHQSRLREWLTGLGLITNLPDSMLAKRVKDEDWWKKAIRKNIRQRRENAWLSAAPTDVKWCSEDGERERQSIIETQEKWASKTEFVSNTGIRIAAPTASEIDRRQRAEMLTIARGVMELACSDAVAFLVTITCPSRFHPTASVKKDGLIVRAENPKFDGSTPRQAFEHYQLQWTRARAAFKRRGVGQHWVMAIQPHEDQTPHAHVVFFESESGGGEIQEILTRYFRDNERERGDHHRVDFQQLEGGSEGGLKYISRAISYINRAADANGDDAEEATKTKQWASTWGIRRFRTSVTNKTAWRLARRPNVLPDDHPVAAAARQNDYANFFKAYRSSQGALVRIEVKNRYDEPSKKVIGMEIDGVVFIKKTEWKQARKGENPVFELEERTVIGMYQGAQKAAPKTQNHPPPGWWWGDDGRPERQVLRNRNFIIENLDLETGEITERYPTEQEVWPHAA